MNRQFAKAESQIVNKHMKKSFMLNSKQKKYKLKWDVFILLDKYGLKRIIMSNVKGEKPLTNTEMLNGTTFVRAVWKNIPKSFKCEFPLT